MSKTLETILQDKKVEVKPIVRSSAYLPAEHDGASLYTGAKWGTTLPINKNTNQLVAILDKEEQRIFEDELNKKKGELDFYNKDNSFWNTFEVVIEKEGLILDLSNPVDYLKYKILLVDPRIAPSWAMRNEDGRYRFALVEEGYEVAEINKRQDKTRRAHRAFGRIEEFTNKMADVLEVYGKKIPKNADAEWLKAEIGKMIEDPKKIDDFLAIVEDPNFETRLMITQAVEVGAIIRSGKNGYKLPGVEDKENNTADNISEMINFLKSPRNHPILLKIKAQIEASK